jgi:hypothetical protein
LTPNESRKGYWQSVKRLTIVRRREAVSEREAGESSGYDELVPFLPRVESLNHRRVSQRVHERTIESRNRQSRILKVRRDYGSYC